MAIPSAPKLTQHIQEMLVQFNKDFINLNLSYIALMTSGSENISAYDHQIQLLMLGIIHIQSMFIDWYSRRLTQALLRIETAENYASLEKAKKAAFEEILSYESMPQPVLFFGDQIKEVAKKVLMELISISISKLHKNTGISRSITIPGHNELIQHQIGYEPCLTWGKDGDFIRPWGITTNRHGEVIVADRLNNRIRIFDLNGVLIRQFGKTGQGDGEFRKCAGVAVSPKDEIIVADKDNHRIQVFDRTGGFLFKFGWFGYDEGDFNYPWDVAVDQNGMIAVTDSRNARVQLFDQIGCFKKLWCNETLNSQQPKKFKYPRGITFDRTGNILVTDFDAHKVLVINRSNNSISSFGTEGTEDGEFSRPSGICVDDHGFILIADTKNQRVQIFNKKHQFLECITGEEAVVMNRPTDICISRDGRMFVVDSENDRIHKF